MTSSTSHSERRAPVLAVKLLGVAVGSWIFCAALTTWFNPEIRFFTRLSALQDAWSRKMNGQYGHKIVVFGGSSCMFSVNGEQMLESYGLPIVNRGLGAGFGVKILTLHALENLEAGDTLVVAMEPGVLTAPTEVTSLAAQFSYARGRPEWAVQPALGLPGDRLGSTLLALRPGSYHALALIGKWIRGRPLYRYDLADAQASGWLRTKVRLALQGPPGHGPHLSEDAKRWLAALRDWCRQREVRLVYSLPWAYCPAEATEDFRKGNADLLLQMAEYVPVLKDTWLGADPDAAHFSDTAWHLNEEGSRLRTKELGRALKQWDVWAPEELRRVVGRSGEPAPPPSGS